MRVGVVAVVVLVGLAGQALASGPVLERIELVGQPATGVRLHLSAPVPALARTLPASEGAPERIYIDLQGASIGPHALTVIQGTGSLLRIRSGQFDDRTTRVVLDLTHALPFSVRPVGRAVVVDIGTSLLAPPPIASATPSAGEERRPAAPRPAEKVASGPPPRPVAPARPIVVAEPLGSDALPPPPPPTITVTSTPASVAPVGPPAIASVPTPSVPRAVDVASLPAPVAVEAPASLEPVGPGRPIELEPTRPAEVAAPRAPTGTVDAPATADPPAVVAAPLARSPDPLPAELPTAEEATPSLLGPPAPATPSEPAAPERATELALLPTPPTEPAPSPAVPMEPTPHPAPASPVTTPIVVLDAGHGGRDPGAEGVGGVLEKDVVLEVTQRLAARLPERLAVTVILTRADDSFVSIDRRLSSAPEGAALFLSLHANACNDPAARGLEVFYGGGSLRTVGSRSTSPAAALLGRCLDQALRDRVGPVRGSARPGDFGVLVRNPLPSALVEIGYLTHPLEAVRTQETQYQELLVEALADGVAEFLRASAPPL